MATNCSCVLAGKNAEKSETGNCCMVGGIQATGIVVFVIAFILPMFLVNDGKTGCGPSWGSVTTECCNGFLCGTKTCPGTGWNVCNSGEVYTTEAGDTLVADIVRTVLIIIGALLVDVTRYVYRGKIASKYNMKFGVCPDYCLVCCCPNCSLMQEAIIVNKGGPQGPGTATVVGAAVGS